MRFLERPVRAHLVLVGDLDPQAPGVPGHTPRPTEHVEGVVPGDHELVPLGDHLSG